MQSKKITGLILGLKPLGELDRIVLVFSLEYGNLRVIAKGVRKIRSHRGFHLDILREVHMELEGTNTGDNLYLREISTTDPFKTIKSNPMNFAAATIVSSFLLKVIPEKNSQKRLYELTRKTFQALNVNNADPKSILLTYFLKATRMLGYLPATLPKQKIRISLQNVLMQLDPQITLMARRTLGMFSRLESNRSS